MTDQHRHEPEPLDCADTLATRPATRRAILRGIAGAGALSAGSALLAACGAGSTGSESGSDSGGSATPATTLRIGYVSPSSGHSASFGSVDRFVIDRFTRALGPGLTIGGTLYRVQFELRDSQSDAQHAARAATDLIGSGVDLMLASSTPETVNPVADACEAARMPCLSTVCPWEAFYFGRGATPTKPFTYTYLFFIGVHELERVYESLWLHGVKNNRTLGVLWPDDEDGHAMRRGLPPLLTKAGIEIVDPGAFPGGTQDFTSIISRFKSSHVQVLNSFATPTDFATFWRQASQQGFRPKIATIAKSGLMPSQMEALGDLGPGITAGVYWHPIWPTTSSVLGMTSRQLSDAYETNSGRQWTQNLGTTAALFEAALKALSSADDPKNKRTVAAALATLRVDTVVGTLDWTKGPVKNVAIQPLVGGKWVRSGGRFPLDIQIVENSGYPALTVQAKDSPLSQSQQSQPS
jgi:branched-chain amino acid transport system substrate-binding protein